MAANIGLTKTLIEILTKMLNKLSKMERNIQQLNNKFNKSCQQNNSAYKDVKDRMKE